jgi:F-type H+-transporting ATPase subunit a
MAAEGLAGFVDDMVKVNIGLKAVSSCPTSSPCSHSSWCRISVFKPLAVIPGLHPFTTTSQFSLTGVLAVMSPIVLIVGFWRHRPGFFKLFVPHGTPLPMIPLIFRSNSFPSGSTVQPRIALFVAMIAGTS